MWNVCNVISLFCWRSLGRYKKLSFRCKKCKKKPWWRAKTFHCTRLKTSQDTSKLQRLNSCALYIFALLGSFPSVPYPQQKQVPLLCGMHIVGILDMRQQVQQVQQARTATTVYTALRFIQSQRCQSNSSSKEESTGHQFSMSWVSCQFVPICLSNRGAMYESLYRSQSESISQSFLFASFSPVKDLSISHGLGTPPRRRRWNSFVVTAITCTASTDGRGLFAVLPTLMLINQMTGSRGCETVFVSRLPQV